MTGYSAISMPLRGWYPATPCTACRLIPCPGDARAPFDPMPVFFPKRLLPSPAIPKDLNIVSPAETLSWPPFKPIPPRRDLAAAEQLSSTANNLTRGWNEKNSLYFIGRIPPGHYALGLGSQRGADRLQHPCRSAWVALRFKVK